MAGNQACERLLMTPQEIDEPRVSMATDLTSYLLPLNAEITDHAGDLVLLSGGPACLTT